MPDIKIALVYFSATEVTYNYVKIIQDGLLNCGCAVQEFNVATYSSRQSRPAFDDFNGIIFGSPVFSDFAPSVINELAFN